MGRRVGGCISSDKIELVKVTNRCPNWRVKVANGTLLKVVAVGDLTLIDLHGFELDPDGSRVLTKTSGTWHNIMVVEGLDPNTVLLSIQRMREDDGINTSFNDDNAAGVSE